MTPSFIFDDIINKVVSYQKVKHQSRDLVNYFIDRHHFTMGIAGTNFNCMSCLELEILGGCIYVSYILFTASFRGLLACT